MSHQFASEHLPPEIQRTADRMNIDPDRIPLYTLPELPFPKGISVRDFLNAYPKKKQKIMLKSIMILQMMTMVTVLQ